MSTRRYVILENPADTGSSEFLGPTAFGGEEEGLPTATVADLTAKEARDAARDPKTAAIAEDAPMDLVAPTSIELAAAPGDAWGIAAVHADTSKFDGAGVVVAVLDTGIDASHPAFKGVTLIQEDFTGAGNGDLDGHGTHCAGTIFGRDVDGRRIGIARGVTKALIGKVLAPGAGSTQTVVDGVLWALRNKARVISMSLGYNLPKVAKSFVDKGWPADLAAARALELYQVNVPVFTKLAGFIGVAPGALLVAATGNESRRDQKAEYEVRVALPAAAEGFLPVGAVGQSLNGLVVAPFSNSAPEVVAPGVNIVSARAGGGLATMSGTSMATPHVAGLAALHFQAAAAKMAGGNVDVIRAESVRSKIIGLADVGPLAPGWDGLDVGNGLAIAPP